MFDMDSCTCYPQNCKFESWIIDRYIINSITSPITYTIRHIVGPRGVYLLDFFCSNVQFYLLLSPYLCFISLLYLDLYALGDDALIS